jgi:hypothetical protein
VKNYGDKKESGLSGFGVGRFGWCRLCGLLGLSNIVHVHVGPTSYTLSLSVDDADIVLGEQASLWGFLQLGDTYVSGATIHIYLTDASGNIIKELGTTSTDYAGFFYFKWTPTETGDYYFKAGYEVPG